ncbi:MAG: hypothetical protein J7J52_01205 [Deltaproteobacteria bacterium]|nr:hypothetical protein [Deltaproteobacteria bacterium]
MINREKIKKWVKQDLIVKDLFREKDLSFDSVLDSVTTEVAVNRAIDLAIKKTMREANAEKENIRQKLIEDLKQYEKENIDTVRQSRLFAVMLNDMVEIINKRFGVKEDD